MRLEKLKITVLTTHGKVTSIPLLNSTILILVDNFRRVEAHFKQRGITGSDSTAMFLKSAFIIFTWFVLYYIAMIKGNVMMAVLLGLETVGFACNLCSVVHSQFGISIAHDGNHGSYSYRHPWLCRLAAHAMDIMGGSSFVWVHQHNIGIEYFWINHLSGHHPYANREGGFYNEDYDPDSTSSFPVLRTHPNQAWKPHIQYQHWCICQHKTVLSL